MALGALFLSAALLGSPTQEAQQLAKRAEASFRAGHAQKALTQATAAFHKAPLPEILLQLGEYHRALDQWTEAVASYREYLRMRPNGPDHAWVLDRIADAESHGRSSQVELSLVPLVANPPPPATAVATPPPPTPAAVAEPLVTAPPPPPTTLSPPPPAAAVLSPPPLVEAPTVTAPAPEPSGHSHALAIGLGAGSAVALGFSIGGIAEVVSYNSYISNAQQHPGTVSWDSSRPGQATAWGTVAVIGGILTAAGITGTLLAW